MLRVGIAGAGFMGTTHAASWAKTPATIAGFYALDSARANALATEYGAEVYDSFDALIDDVDVVDVCTPTYVHYEMVMRAAQAGKQIICEKPLARTLAQAQEMVRTCAERGLPLLVGHVVRFFPEYALAKATVERGDVGDVAVIRLSRCSYQPRGTDDWFLDTEKSGGVMLDLMIHDFDYARWVAGDVESVYTRSVGSRRPIKSGDYAIAILKHKNGAISNVEGGWAYPPPMFRTALEIAGSGGLIEHPAGSSTPIALYLKQQDNGEVPAVALPRSPLAEDPYATEIKHFYDVLTKGVTPRVTAEDGLHALQIALAAIESARTGQQITLEALK